MHDLSCDVKKQTMAEIAPFKAVFYNPKIVHLEDVVTPPYDVIDPVQKEKFYQKSPYNIIRIILGKERDKYVQANNYFTAWQRDKIFCQDKKEVIYLYRQRYCIRKKKKESFGFLALLKLESLKNGSVIPHEKTFLQHRKDRYQLLAHCRANFSPIFSLYQDTEQRIGKELKKETGKIPFLEFRDGEKVMHQVWRLTDKVTIKRITSLMKNKKIYIADGHHRYQSALLFHQRNPERSSPFVLSYFTNILAPSLSILSTHRLINKRKKFAETMKQVEKFFEIRETEKKEFFKQLQFYSHRHSFGLYPGKGKFFILILRNEKIMKNFVNKEDVTKYLDVTIAHKLLIEHLFKSNEVSYFKDEELLLMKVDEEKGKTIAIFLNPIRATQLMEICGKRKVLPQKSTYFYPKIPAGLLIHRFD